MKYLSIFIRVALLALGQSLDCHSASEVSLMDMGKSVNVWPQQSTAKQKPCAYFLGYTVAKFMGPTWGPPGFCRPQMGPMLAPRTLLSGVCCIMRLMWDCSHNLVNLVVPFGTAISASILMMSAGRQILEVPKCEVELCKKWIGLHWMVTSP